MVAQLRKMGVDKDRGAEDVGEEGGEWQDVPRVPQGALQVSGGSTLNQILTFYKKYNVSA